MSMIYCLFFKQKTAYEMRISDWSSDVCSSDLSAPRDPSSDRGVAAIDQQFRSGHERRFIAGEIYAKRSDFGGIGHTPHRRGITDRFDIVFRHVPGEARPYGSRKIGRASCRERVWPYV